MSFSNGVTWPYLRAPVVRRAAASMTDSAVRTVRHYRSQPWIEWTSWSMLPTMNVVASDECSVPATRCQRGNRGILLLLFSVQQTRDTTELAVRPFSSACWSCQWWRQWRGSVWRTSRRRWRRRSTGTCRHVSLPPAAVQAASVTRINTPLLLGGLSSVTVSMGGLFSQVILSAVNITCHVTYRINQSVHRSVMFTNSNIYLLIGHRFE